jgi:5'-AMP-activated protein kinase regulatory beta subunit
MKKQKSHPKKHRVHFTLTTRAAQAVYLVGDFNDWNEASHPMKQDADGTWKKTVVLAPGTYQYKYLVDGGWQEDPANPNRCRNQFGTYNCIAEVK